MSVAAGWYEDPTTPGQMRWWNGQSWTTHTTPSPSASDTVRGTPLVPTPITPANTAREAVEAEAEIARIRAELIETRDLMLLQEVGLYLYAHPLDDSVQYRDALQSLREEIKVKIKAGEAVVGTKKWAINGSAKEGAKMVADFSKLLLRAYNAEAETAVKGLKPFALDSTVSRLDKTRQAIAKLGKSMSIEITDSYHALRVQELELTADYRAKLEEEKEREREERARLRDEAAARKEFEQEQARLEKERNHYQNALEAVRERGDEIAIKKLETQLAELDSALEGVINRAANIRAGYVYVISNIGAYGPGVVKIGMTRRLEPMDRVRELGDASVPFRFDVHVIIFSDDAVGLEYALHQKFASHRLNLVNLRREFFYVKPRDVEAALLELHGNLLTFVEEPEAMEWRQSQTVRKGMQAS
jgi:hypothetical protein